MDNILKQKQEELELTTSDTNLDVYFESDKPALIADAMFHISEYIESIEHWDYEYTIKGGEKRTRYDLVEIHEWLIDATEEKLENILFKMMVRILTSKHGINAQALAGIVFNRVEFDEDQRRLKLAEVFLNAIAESPYVKLRHTREEIFFERTVELQKDLVGEIQELGHPLPMLYPPRVTSNYSVGFETTKFGMISGGVLKQHDKDICLDHFNRLNQTEYKVELRLGLICEPKFDPTPKLKDNGWYEEQSDIDKRFETYQRIKDELPRKIKRMCEFGNKFYIPHYADSRIRTYAKQYHFNYLGMKFIKGAIQFSKAEIIEPNF